MNVTIKLVTSVETIAKNLTNAIVGTPEHVGYMFTPHFDPEIESVGNAIIAVAKANLALSGTGKEVIETVQRIGWARKPIATSQSGISGNARSPAARGVRVRGGLVVSDHPASVRLEFGTGPRTTTDKFGKTRTRKGYTATKFMTGAALTVAGQRKGLTFDPRSDTDIQIEEMAEA